MRIAALERLLEAIVTNLEVHRRGTARRIALDLEWSRQNAERRLLGGEGDLIASYHFHLEEVAKKVLDVEHVVAAIHERRRPQGTRKLLRWLGR